MTTSAHIQYRGYHRGPKDTGGSTSLYASSEDALAAAKRCSFSDETAWVNPEFVGSMDNVLRANTSIRYTERKPKPTRMTIEAGETFVVGDILVADYQVTPADIASWLIKGTVEVA